MKKYGLGFIFLCAVVVVVIMIMPSKKEFTRDFFYMDTYINVKLYTKKEKALEAFKGIDEIFKKYHQLTDPYNDYSGVINLKYINDHLAHETIKMDESLYNIIKFGYDWYNKSNNLLNINMGEAIKLWKKYRDDGNGIPTDMELRGINVDINNIELLSNNQIRGDGVNIDLGAISKGYTTEVVGKYLEKMKIDEYLINAGGNVLCGKSYKKAQYKIGLENPNAEGGIYKVIKATNVAIVTSGGYARNFIYDGKMYHHIIDPHTMYPSTYMKSVTVIAPSSADADALSTTLFLMSVADGQAFLEKYPDVQAIWYTLDDKVITTSGIFKYE